jgi:hypothetical protein
LDQDSSLLGSGPSSRPPRSEDFSPVSSVAAGILLS